MSGISIGNLPNQSILKKINDIAADVDNLDLEGVNNLKSKLSELVAPELGSSDIKAISQKVVTENIQQLNTEVNNKINKVESAQNGNLPSFDNGHIKDSKIPASNIAQANGYYESMIVGASKNLAGNNIVTAKYTYRPTADTTDVADGVAKISSVKGNTIVWNQMINIKTIQTIPGLTIEKIDDYTLKINGTLNKSDINNKNFVNIAYNNIKYPFSELNKIVFNLKHISGSVSSDIGISNGGFSAKKIGENHLVTSSEAWTSIIFYLQVDNDAITFEDYVFSVQCFDLTQMFGEGNEPTLEEFEAMFPNSYYEYNEGELRSIEDFSIKSIGFNQWDEETEKGTINGNGVEVDGDFYRSFFIPILPNAKYYISSNNTTNYPNRDTIRIRFYDYNKKYLNKDGGVSANREFITPADASYVRICSYYYADPPLPKYTKGDLCINLSHSGIKNGEYESYREDILPINISAIKDNNGEVLFPNGLCSAGEAHDELVYDKSLGKWKAIKRIGSVDLGSFDYSLDENRMTSKSVINAKLTTNTKIPNIICLRYLPDSSANTYNNVNDKRISIKSNGQISIFDSSYSDTTTFKESIQGQILYYELAEPIEVVLDDFTSNYKVSDWGTEEILMNTTPIVPVIYDVEYALNAVDTLRNMPTNYISKESLDAFLSALGGAMGGTWTATYNETNGRYDFSFSANATELIDE